MTVLTGIGLLATCPPGGGQAELGLVPEAALAWEGDRIAWVGPEGDLPDRFRGQETWSAGGRLVIPGLIDCHTHLAFGGWRSHEFVLRMRGASYLEIAQQGGGIMSTVRQTRLLPAEALADRCRGFLAGMIALGVTTVEAKSGYGLTVEDEVKLLEVYAGLARTGQVRLIPTFLGAHVVPPEYRDQRGAYLALLIDRLIPEIAARGLARFCDVFVEESAFSIDEARRLLLAAAAAGLRPKLHADQLSDGGGAQLAAELGAVSADHLECVSEAGIAALAQAGVVAVSLPLAALYLNQPPTPARRLIEAGVPVAVATDFNPGTAPSWHLPLALTLACTLQRMAPAEALKGATAIAARALGLEGITGSLAPGLAADFAVIDAPDVDQWLYHFRPNSCVKTVAGGTVRWQAAALA